MKELLPETDLELGSDVKFKIEAHRISLEKQLKLIQTLDSEIAEFLDADLIEKKTNCGIWILRQPIRRAFFRYLQYY